MRFILGEALGELRLLSDNSVDVVVTDPPYSSGGLHKGDRSRSTGSKYVHGGVKTIRPDFSGDSRDQRSFHYWSALWIGECFRIVRPGGYFLTFTDWRQLPVTTDALQAGDFTWRGICPWDKGGGARAPHTGYFRHQCEYVVWGTKGPCELAHGRGPFPGYFRVVVRQADKFHQVGKPVELLLQLLRCVIPRGKVLDPFAGSFTTAVACARLGLDFIGIERDPDNLAIGRRRLAAEGVAIAA